MGLDVRLATDEDREQWNDLVARSPHGTPFHTLECLEYLAEVTGDDCYHYVGYKGQERLGIFPVFLREHGPFTVAFSPPPDLKVTYLGPALDQNGGSKRRRVERQNREFVQQVLADVADRHGPSYYHVKPSPNYVDVRPFVWDGFEGPTNYTHVVDLTVDEDALFDAFSSDARSAVRACRDADCEIIAGDAETIRTFVPRLAALHDERDAPFGIDAAFVVDLWRALPDDEAHVYEARVDGEFAGGWVVLEDADTAYYWQAYSERDADVSVNDYAVWQIIQDAMDRGVQRLDLVGANQLNLSRYKAKFAPELVAHRNLAKGTRAMELAASVYKRFR